MQTQTTVSAVAGGAARATAPATASMVAAASCGGATDRITNAVVLVTAGRVSDRNPRTAKTTAAQTHSTPAMSMGTPYEAPGGGAAPGC